MPDAKEGRFVFGDFTLDVRRRRLLQGGRHVKLRPQSYAVLETLVRNSGRLVSKEQLQTEVWGKAVVTGDSLIQCLVDVRKALGDTDKSIVQTIPRRGYVFGLEVGHAGSRPEWFEKAGGLVTQRARLALAIGLILVVAVVSGYVLNMPADREGTNSFDPPRQSVAVLPFVDLSDQQELRFFGESLSAEVINKLSLVPELHVIARTSSFSTDLEEDIWSISRRLNVRYVLEGSVRQDKNEVRVVAQFVDSFNDKLLWSKSFIGDMEKSTAVQAEIALAVASVLRVGLSEKSMATQSTDPATLSLFGHARHLINSRQADQLPVAIALLEEALRRDPNFVRGMTELARAYYERSSANQVSLDEALEESGKILERALEMAPEDAVANALVGWRELFHNRNYQESARRYRIAFGADPRNLDVIKSAIPVWLTIGRAQEAVQLAEFVVARDPLCYACHRYLLLAYIATERYDQAEEYASSLKRIYTSVDNLDFERTKIYLLKGMNEQALELMEQAPSLSHPTWLVFRAIAHHRLGHPEKQQQAMEALHREFSSRESYRLAFAYASTGDIDSAFYWLEVYYKSTKFFADVHRNAFLKPLRDDPRWNALTQRYTLSDAEFSRMDYPSDLPG